ncbi:hypothetical protein DL768_007764 [Monosporascus sp. mg162]|nr:hypothetical protein DL768_007764 [Monosporascus sp. mg162]
MSTSTETTVPTLAQQLQERIQQLKVRIQQLAALADPISAVVISKLKVKKPEPYDGTGNVQGFLTQVKMYLRLERVEGDVDRILVMAGFLKRDVLD